MSRPNFRWEQVLYVVMIASLVVAVAAFMNLGRFNRYMADDYCLSTDLQKSGFIHAQITNYLQFGGRFTYAALISAVESFGPKTASLGPPLCLVLWVLASVWALFEIAAINRCQSPFFISCLGTSLVIFAMLAAADNLAQSVYWESGYLLYTVPLVLCTVYVAVVAFAVRKSIRGLAAMTLIILGVALTLIAGGFNEPFTLAQTTGHGLALLVCYFSPPASARRRALPFLFAGMFGSLIATVIMVAAPGNGVRESSFPVSRDVLTVVTFTFRGTCGFILRKLVQVPFVTVLLCAIPAYVATRYYKSIRDHNRKVARAFWRYLILLPLTGFLLVFLCYLPGVYGTGGLVARARLIPEFIFVCTAISSAYLLGNLLADRLVNAKRNLVTFRAVTLSVIAAITVLGSFRTTRHVWQLAIKAKVNAALWDRTDREVRTRKGEGVLDQTIPLIDIETGLGGPQSELHLERDPSNWKNKCVAGYYGINSIRTP
jgi:hypothetical protein